MKATIYGLLVAVMVAGPSVAFATTTKDSSRFDCRETVQVKVTSGKYPKVKFVKACPHPEEMENGECVTNIWGQMRCLR